MSQAIIKVLDQNTANKIAAGEVVERPSSVVKELVENSLDAYSKVIEVAIQDGGASHIRVTDDGSGMSREDAELAILRHATSKINSVDDIYSVQSLGFRGEALPSIASVSRFSLTTRLADAELASYVEVTGGEITDAREAGAGLGTTIIVNDLFFNTPARRKFMKTAATESGYIHDILGRLALSHPEVAFKLLNNGRLVLSTPGSGSLLDAIASLYGPKTVEAVLPIEYQEEMLIISGYVAKPTLIKSSRQWQTLIINGRTVSSRMIAKAIDNAYHSLLPKSGYPLVVLNISLPPEAIDVNVHPQKSEVKLANEGAMFKAVYRAISAALTNTEESVPAMTAAASISRTWSNQPPHQNLTHSLNPVAYSPEPAPMNTQLWNESPPSFTETRNAIKQHEEIFNITSNDINSVPTSQSDLAMVLPEPESTLMPLGQIDNCYIIARATDGLYIIDQHAAHERILYDKMSLATGRIPVQQLLMPLLLDFDTLETRLISEHTELFFELGFTLEMIGPNSWRLTESPADIQPGEARAFLIDVLRLVQTDPSPTAAKLRHAYLQTAACRAAIKAGELLNMRQMSALITELNATALPYTCPHGRPTIIKFSPADLAKMFKRT
ncbi:MAG: mutL [Firmicutes bacterium]|nr:mutL [Bacillota bacterium]